MIIGKALYSILSGDSGLSALVGTRIYPELIEQEADLPAICYALDSTTPNPTKDSTSTVDQNNFRVFCVAKGYAECIDIGEAVRAALDRNGGSIAGVEVASINFKSSDIERDFDQGVYVIDQGYTARVLRIGQAPEVNLVATGGAVRFEEVDGSPSEICARMIVPNKTLTIAAGVATFTPSADPAFRSPATAWNYLRAAMSSAVLGGGASAQDFGSASAVTMQINEVQETSGTAITFDGNSYTATIEDDGNYRVSVQILFESSAGKGTMKISIEKNGVALPAFAICGILGTAGVTEATAAISRTFALAKDDTLKIRSIDISSATGTVYVDAATLEIERVN
jgi:hypothetical protein